jgi:uncharacterized protein YjeT (DUF2065 family)
MLRPLPLPIVVEMLGATLVLLGLFLVIRGTLPRWLPSGFLDQAGNRAELSRPVYRWVGVTSVLVGVAAPMTALSRQVNTMLLAIMLVAIALLSAVPGVVVAVIDQHRRSLRRKRSTYWWSMLGLIVATVLNGLLFAGMRP